MGSTPINGSWGVFPTGGQAMLISSCLPAVFALVAQLAAQRLGKTQVVGSIPTQGSEVKMIINLELQSTPGYDDRLLEMEAFEAGQTDFRRYGGPLPDMPPNIKSIYPGNDHAVIYRLRHLFLLGWMAEAVGGDVEF